MNFKILPKATEYFQQVITARRPLLQYYATENIVSAKCKTMGKSYQHLVVSAGSRREKIHLRK